jgi:transcriptional regulator with XRE-family HTH domain
MDTNTLKTIIGLRIVEARWSLGLTQAELALRCGYDKSYLNRIEKGKTLPETETLNRISEKLSKQPWWLLKPWSKLEKRIKELKFYIKLYKGHLPPFVKKKMEKKH